MTYLACSPSDGASRPTPRRRLAVATFDGQGTRGVHNPAAEGLAPPNSISGLWGVWDLLARHTSCRRLLEVVLEQGQPLSEDLVLIG